MKSPSAATQVAQATLPDDNDDIFGPPRTYPTGYYPPKNRPSMISAKYRQKEERRKILKISINKLKKIEDPEASLCRSVLINNTLKRLQKEVKDDKNQKQQQHHHLQQQQQQQQQEQEQLSYHCQSNDSFISDNDNVVLNIKSVENEQYIMKNNNLVVVVDNDNSERINDDCNVDNDDNDDDDDTQKVVSATAAATKIVEFVVENDFDTKLAEEINTVTAKNLEVFNDIVDDPTTAITMPTTTTTTTTQSAIAVASATTVLSRKRSFDEMEDCDVQDVLSQFYMPPTPRMLTCIDDDEDVNVVDDTTSTSLTTTTTTTTTIVTASTSVVKRIKLDDLNNENINKLNNNNLNSNNNNNNNSVVLMMCGGVDNNNKIDDFSVNNFINNNLPVATTNNGTTLNNDSRLRYTMGQNEIDTASANASFSCGHASMFNELQSNVYHNLIASLET